MRTLSFNIDVLGVSNESQELAKIELQLKNIKKEKQELDKLARQGFASQEQLRQLAAYNSEIKKQETNLKQLKAVVDTADDSLARMRQELIRLKNEYAATSEAGRQKLVPQITKLSQEVSKAEQAIGVHSRGVGNYKGAILDAGKQLLGFTSIAALAVTAVNKLTEAFKQTEQGTKFFGQVTQQMKTLVQSLIGGEGLKESFKNAILAGTVAENLNKSRIGDREDLKVIAQYETDINLLRLKSVDLTLSLKEQKQALIEAEKLENELIAFKIKDKEEDLQNVRDLLKLRKDDVVLLDQQAKLEAEIIQLRGSESLRIASKLATLREKERKEIEANNEAIIKGQQKLQEEVDKYEEDQKQKAIKALEDQEKLRKAKAESDLRFNVEIGKKLYEQNQKDAETQWQAILDRDAEELKLIEDKEKLKADIINAGLQGIENGATAVFNSKKQRLQAEMQAELNNENLTQSQKLEIQKRYAREQQKIDVQQAIINGALAVGNALLTKPFIPAGLIAAALATAQTGIQVATIKAQKFATGGKIQGGLQIHPDTSKDNTLIYAKQGETVLTDRHVAALGGSAAMRRIKVPGYAMGGYIGQQAPEIGSNNFDINALARLMNSIDVRLDVNKLNSAQREVQIINETQKI